MMELIINPFSFASGPPPFSPSDVAGLQLWLAADQITGLSDGDPVTAWPDQSGNGNDAAQATGAKKPTFKTAIQNGEPVVRFDGIDDTLVIPSDVLDSSSVDRAATMFFAVSPATLSNGNGYVALVDAEAGGGVRLFALFIGNSYCSFWNNNATYTPSPAFSTGPQIVCIRTSGATATVFVNGTQVATVATGTTSSSGCQLEIGGNPSGSASLLQGDYAEVLYFNAALSTDDRERVEAYLNDKYAIF